MNALNLVELKQGIRPVLFMDFDILFQEETQLTDWSRQLEQDTEKLKAEANRQQLRMV